MSKLKNRQQGFTLIELMIATIIFSVILLGATTALIYVGRMYYKGVISTRTQGITRSITDEISRAIQFSGEQVSDEYRAEYGGRTFCVGSNRYTYMLNAQVNDEVAEEALEAATHRARHAMWKDQVTNADNCVSEEDPVPDLRLGTPSDNPGGQELLDQHMRLSWPAGIDPEDFKMVAPVGDDSDDNFAVNVVVIYGDDDLLNEPDHPTQCRSITVNAQWCAVSNLSTTVQKRLQ